MENVETNSASRVNLASLLLGLVAGVTATVLFATYNERRFKRVTQTTRAVGDRTGELLDGVETRMLERADEIVDSARDGVKQLSKDTRHAVNSATKSVEATVDRMADSAQRMIDAPAHEG